jgi:predicted kinase
MNKHTKGPWKSETYSVSSGERGVCVKHGDDTVVDLAFNQGWTRQTVRANARLIAAAPAMLEALQTIRNDLDVAWHYDRIQKGTAEDIIEIIITALKKAGGDLC